MLLHWFKSFFIDELRVFIHPQRIVLLRLTRTLKYGFKQQLIHELVIDLPSEERTADELMQLMVEALKSALVKPEWLGAMPVIIVSNHFTFYSVIPWNSSLTGELERQAYLKHYFNLSFGEASKSWDFRMSEPGYGKATLSSAISSSLLIALHQVFEQANTKIVAVYPHLMLAVNQTLNQIKMDKQHSAQTENFWLVAIQNGRLCLALMENNGWQLIKNVAIETDITEQLTALIQRQTVVYSVEYIAPVLLYWPESQSAQSLKLESYEVVKVSPHQFDLQNHPLSISLPAWALI